MKQKQKKNMLNAHAQGGKDAKRTAEEMEFFRLLLSRIPRATSKQPPTWVRMSNFAVHDSSTRTLLYYYLTCTHHRVGGVLYTKKSPKTRPIDVLRSSSSSS